MKNLDLLDNVSKMVHNKRQAEVMLKTWLSLGEQDGEDPSYLASLDQAIKLLEKSNNLNQFRQKVQRLKKSS